MLNIMDELEEINRLSFRVASQIKNGIEINDQTLLDVQKLRDRLLAIDTELEIENKKLHKLMGDTISEALLDFNYVLNGGQGICSLRLQRPA